MALDLMVAVNSVVVDQQIVHWISNSTRHHVHVEQRAVVARCAQRIGAGQYDPQLAVEAPDVDGVRAGGDIPAEVGRGAECYGRHASAFASQIAGRKGERNGFDTAGSAENLKRES